MLELIKGYLIKLDDKIDNEILGDAISKVDDIIIFFKMNIDNKRLNLHFSTFDVAFDIALFQYLARHYTQGKLISRLGRLTRRRLVRWIDHPARYADPLGPGNRPTPKALGNTSC